MRIKIGDRVKNIVEFDVDGVFIPVGIKGTVIDNPCHGVFDVDWDSPINQPWCQIEEELEIVS